MDTGSMVGAFQLCISGVKYTVFRYAHTGFPPGHADVSWIKRWYHCLDTEQFLVLPIYPDGHSDVHCFKVLGYDQRLGHMLQLSASILLLLWPRDSMKVIGFPVHTTGFMFSIWRYCSCYTYFEFCIRAHMRVVLARLHSWKLFVPLISRRPCLYLACASCWKQVECSNIWAARTTPAWAHSS